VAAINLGVDFGSTGLRVAYSRPGEPGRFFALTGAEWPWLLCEPAAEGVLPVSFPSVKSRLGVAGADVYRVAPAEVVTRALDTVRRRVIEETSATIRQTVISVPARYIATQRTALVDAAGEAGLGKVGLVNDSVAAVIGHTGGDHTGTFLVYGMGYSGFELGLVRAVRSRYRVLGYEGASTPDGSTFDEQILGAWLALLREHGISPDAERHGESRWLLLRETAEQVKELLAAGRSVLFPMFIPGPDGNQQLTVHFEQDRFESMARSLIARTLDRANALFEQSGLSRENVEAVLLVGGSTRMPQLHKLASGLGGATVPVGVDVVALGAALHANQLTGRSSSTYEEQPSVAAVEPTEPLREAPPLAATLLTVPGNDPPGGAAEKSGVDRARQLIKEGRSDDAEDELRRLVSEAQDLLTEIAAARSRQSMSHKRVAAAPGPTGADNLLAIASGKVEKGQYQDAINFAHMAWDREPNRPDVFDGMIDIHCAAAMANPTIANFTRDDKWLRCALQHDPSNARVRGLLAERSYLHGKELHQTGRKADATRALEHALTWNPEHQATEELLHRANWRR
jgi:hypothetical protein